MYERPVGLLTLAVLLQHYLLENNADVVARVLQHSGYNLRDRCIKKWLSRVQSLTCTHLLLQGAMYDFT